MIPQFKIVRTDSNTYNITVKTHGNEIHGNYYVSIDSVDVPLAVFLTENSLHIEFTEVNEFTTKIRIVYTPCGSTLTTVYFGF